MIRPRHWFTRAGTTVVLLALFATDPDKGISTALLLLGLATPILMIALAHIARKALFDYKAADMEDLFLRARESPTGAGLALIALAIIINGMLGLFGKAHAQDLIFEAQLRPLPALAYIYAPILKQEQLRVWADHPQPELLAGLVEQESCVSLKSTRCWSPSARLKTSREEGAGLGQITRAFRPDGSIRFDSLSDMRRQYSDLSEWSWDNVYQRPDLQLRALVLMDRQNYLALRTVDAPAPRLALADAAYNGGLGGVQSERRACGLIEGCDPQQWFGHVELHCLKSRTGLYGQRSACDINREHVRQVMLVRSGKYRRLMSWA